MSKKMYFTLAGLANFFGQKPFANNKYFILRKDSKNYYDSELITAELPGYGSVGYIASHPMTRAKGTISAGRLYDKIGDTAVGKIRFLTDDFAVCSLVSKKKAKKIFMAFEHQYEAQMQEINILEQFLSSDFQNSVVIRFIQSVDSDISEDKGSIGERK